MKVFASFRSPWPKRASRPRVRPVRLSRGAMETTVAPCPGRLAACPLRSGREDRRWVRALRPRNTAAPVGPCLLARRHAAREGGDVARRRRLDCHVLHVWRTIAGLPRLRSWWPEGGVSAIRAAPRGAPAGATESPNADGSALLSRTLVAERRFDPSSRGSSCSREMPRRGRRASRRTHRLPQGAQGPPPRPSSVFA